jgi:exodeoxyribonuclease VIII
MKDIIDVMLDLETLGLGNTPVISQLSAVIFDIETGTTFEEYNEKVSPQSCVKLGLKIDAGTVEWWLKQDQSILENVIVKSITGGKNIKEVLATFSNFLKDIKKTHKAKEIRIWGNGTLADNKWLESAFDLAQVEKPFKYWEHSDVRTLVDLGWRLTGVDHKKDLKFEGEKHNAIDDCKHQIKYCSAIYKELTNARK